MQFEIAFDFEDTRCEFPIDIKRLIVRGGEQEGRAIALVVAHEESGRSVAAKAADSAASMHLASGGPHDAQEALGVYEFSGEG